MKTLLAISLLPLWGVGFPAMSMSAAETSVIHPVVEAEEEVYRFEPAKNGAGPMWCRGSTCLVRMGDSLFASGLETLKEAKPLNNCRWRLFRRGSQGWDQWFADSAGRTREPCPLAGFNEGSLFLSANPSLKPENYSGPARPEIWQFSGSQKTPAAGGLLRPGWRGTPEFTEHSYRSFAADGPGRELILFQNLGYTHAEWAFYNHEGGWQAGQLKWPWGGEYDQPQPIRVCYPTVALQQRAVHFCGVSDVVEPNNKWREYKKQITGNEWDYDFRRLFYTWTPDITTQKFADWVEIASRDKTCGWITPCDLWLAPDGAAHLLWTERVLDERLRAKFFPEARQSHSLNYAIVRAGKVVHRRTLVQAEEGGSREIPAFARFQVTRENRLVVFFYVQGTDRSGRTIAENRLMEILDQDSLSPAVAVPLKYPMNDFFTATIRGGSPACNTLELLGPRAGQPQVIGYARVKLLQD